ncbi:MAG: beta galactosidase jelly roll domain-containing protein, partial [Chitinispirillaceae bacterium]|nr:beta galactosidase jelly roll domain-containing protein [Chitinispirillaceae bacterium]
MFQRIRKAHLILLFVSLFLAYPGFSQAQALKRKAGFNQNWKFYKGDMSGAYTPGFNDATWAVVNIPHSPSYDSLAPASEMAYYVGTCWYRKSFALPANVKLAFIEFEAAMQSATVYLNGTQIDIHNNSGYTPFVLNISNQVVRGGNNVLAVRLNNQKSADIPPGWASAGPD